MNAKKYLREIEKELDKINTYEQITIPNLKKVIKKLFSSEKLSNDELETIKGISKETPRSEILWFVSAMDAPTGSGEELQFIEYTKQDALEDVFNNRCDFAEMSFKYCKIYAKKTVEYLGIVEEGLEYLLKKEDNPFRAIWFKMDFKTYKWKQLSDLEYRQEFYNYCKENPNLFNNLEQKMQLCFDINWKEGIKL